MNNQYLRKNRVMSGSVKDAIISDQLAPEAGGFRIVDSARRSLLMQHLTILLRLFLSAGVAAGLTGCETTREYSLTYKLWDNRAFSQFKEPSLNGNVQLFQAAPGGDLLVAYDEVSEKNDRVRRRAFFLNANLAKLQAGQKPRFVNPRKSANLAELPLVRASANASNAPPAALDSPVLSADGQQLTFFNVEPEQITIELPTYETSGGTIARVLVTPLAVTGDVVMVGVVVGLVVAYAWAHGGGSWQ